MSNAGNDYGGKLEQQEGITVLGSGSCCIFTCIGKTKPPKGDFWTKTRGGECATPWTPEVSSQAQGTLAKVCEDPEGGQARRPVCQTEQWGGRRERRAVWAVTEKRAAGAPQAEKKVSLTETDLPLSALLCVNACPSSHCALVRTIEMVALVFSYDCYFHTVLLPFHTVHDRIPKEGFPRSVGAQ